MIETLPWDYILTEYGPFGVILAYLVIRDRKMGRAVVRIAEAVDGVDEGEVRRDLDIRVAD